VVKRSSTDATVAGVVSYGQGCARPSNIFELFSQQGIFHIFVRC